ncbi:thyrotropin-releasing hormone receptor [Plakobranchus ocellatus]|uniref:Thyrotropin-releasing hormone receptor n=1 Tax=Plakobranchus ocellatus TaxID=259542 RepID=A0AAV3YBJ6_9GAST|nr:thyrotropin-releasing hormone receptor [Plakobranchus ocellatus]
MFIETFDPIRRAAFEKLGSNFTDIPHHLLVCIFQDVTASFPIADGHWSVSDNELANAITIAEQSCQWSYQFEKILKLIALIIGVPGNLMAAVVSFSMERSPTIILLIALSLGDLITVVTRALIPDTYNVAVEVFKRTIGFYPNAVLVLICFERYMAVSYPWHKKLFFTTRNTCLLLEALLVLYILVAMFCYFITTEVHVEIYLLSLIISFCLFGIPCPFLMTFNALTIKKLKQMTAIQAELHEKKDVRSTWSKNESSTTLMILIASVVFVSLNGPLFFVSVTWFLVETIWAGENIIVRTKVDFMLTITYWLTFMHHSINFYLYILGTRRFRKRFFYILKQRRFNLLVERFTLSRPASTVLDTTMDSKLYSFDIPQRDSSTPQIVKTASNSESRLPEPMSSFSRMLNGVLQRSHSTSV